MEQNIGRCILILLLIILSWTNARSQSYTYDQIINKADSIVRSNVDKDLLKYFRRDSVKIRYSFRRPHWRKYLTRDGTVGSGEITKGHFERAIIFYNFYYKEPMINADLHKGFLTYSIDIVFDSDLNFVNQIEDQSFIPQYLKEKRQCDFISMDNAIAIAKEESIKSGIDLLSATLDYDNGNFKRYCWWVSSSLREEKHGGHIHGEADTVTIDAVTGEVLRHELTTYGALH